MSNNVSNIKQMQSITQGDKKNIQLQTNKANINATNVNVVASPTIAASALSTQLISNLTWLLNADVGLNDKWLSFTTAICWPPVPVRWNNTIKKAIIYLCDFIYYDTFYLLILLMYNNIIIIKIIQIFIKLHSFGIIEIWKLL